MWILQTVEPLPHYELISGDYDAADLFSRHIEQVLYCSESIAIATATKKHLVFATQLQAAIGFRLGDVDLFHISDEALSDAVTLTRELNFVEEELPTSIVLAESCRRQNKLIKAREVLDGAWELLERGPYPLFHADALNVLSQIERDAGNTKAAIEAATRAYELAWCDGISEDGKQCYAYWWGLQAAKKHLEELGAPILKLPPFDPSKYDPLPEIDWEKLGLEGDEK